METLNSIIKIGIHIYCFSYNVLSINDSVEQVFIAIITIIIIVEINHEMNHVNMV